MVVPSGFGPSLPDGMGVHRTLLTGSLRSSGGSDKDSSQKLTDLFAIVNTFPGVRDWFVIRLGMSNTQNISPQIAQNNFQNHSFVKAWRGSREGSLCRYPSVAAYVAAS